MSALKEPSKYAPLSASQSSWYCASWTSAGTVSKTTTLKVRSIHDWRKRQMISRSLRHTLLEVIREQHIFQGILSRKQYIPSTSLNMFVPNIAPPAMPYHIDSELVLDPNLELAAEEQNPELRLSDGQLLLSSYIWSMSSSSS